LRRGGADDGAIGGLSAVVALMTAQSAARADEWLDLRTNQELLQRRVDQLAQAPGPGNPYGVGDPRGPVNVQMTGGSFPRSFLIPGTDTSIRVGGEIRMMSLYWITGGAPNQNPQGTNTGTTGQLNSIPLKGANQAGRERGDNVLTMSPQQSKMSVETRTPTAYGEARSFLEFDFAGGVSEGARPQATSNNLTPRLRYAYGTLGPLLFGQANSNFNDSDAGMESLEFGGLIGGGGPSRVPQIRWTQPLAQWGLLGALSVAAESPETEMWAPGAGVFGANASGTLNATSNTTTCINTVSSTTGQGLLIGAGGAAPGTVVTGVSSTSVPCTVTTAFANPLKNTAPEMVAAWYIPQPWGHVDFAAVVRPLLRVETTAGAGLDRTFTGYGFAFSGDVKPRWFGWDRDFFTWNFVVGEAMGRYLYAGAGSSVGLVSNITTARLATDSVLVKPTRGFAGNIAYRHQWSPEWRSNIGAGYWRLDIPGLNGAVCPAGSAATAGGGCGLNEELVMGKANLIWAPVSFVDIGLEYNYGRRKVVSGHHGDEHVVVNRLRLRF
ncbi:MAG TPA: DcaP family trimeric outer membrane transporter, partial [Mycobacterium sp.]|nr:DcaP family trimeric outer membrane transporter [Mycobacterium sp.]